LFFMANGQWSMKRLNLQTNPSEVLYDGKLSCTLQMLIEDIQDIIDQCLEWHITQAPPKNKQCTFPKAHSVVDRETSIITHYLFYLVNLLDSALQNILGRILEICTSFHMINTRSLSCGSVNGWHGLPMPIKSRYITFHLNIWGLRLNNKKNNSVRQVHLRVILSTTSLAPNCLSLWEWCIVVIGNEIHWYQHNKKTQDVQTANISENPVSHFAVDCCFALCDDSMPINKLHLVLLRCIVLRLYTITFSIRRKRYDTNITNQQRLQIMTKLLLIYHNKQWNFCFVVISDDSQI
jgi:hypothetical protein